MDYEETNGGGETNSRIYVSNLDYRCAWQDLKDFFNERIGDVAHANVTAGKGWGIVEFNSADSARRAMEECNDQEWRGRPLHIREDRESDRGGSRSGIGSYSASDGFTPDKDARVYVGNLVWQLTKEELISHMSQGGEVKACEILKNPNGRAKGCAIIQYATEADAENAKNKLNNTDLKGRMISVREDREQGISTTGAPIPSASRPTFRSFPPSGGRGGGYQGQGRGGYQDRQSWGGNYQGSSDSTSSREERVLIVEGLDPDTKWTELKDHFAQFNPQRVDIFGSQDEGSEDGGCNGIVRFKTVEDANAALAEKNGSTLEGKEGYAIGLRMDEKI